MRDDAFNHANRGESIREAMLRVRSEGGVTGRLPAGYRFSFSMDGGKWVDPDPAMAALVREAFRLASEGRHSMAEIAERLREKGWVNAEGNAVSTGTLHQILHNEIYMRGIGGAESLVDAATFYRVQGALAARKR